MSQSQATDSETILDGLCQKAESLCHIAETAERNGKSLSGQGFYPNKFHAALIEFTRLESDAVVLFNSTDLDQDTMASVKRYLADLKSHTTARTRSTALRELRLVIASKVAPHFQSRAVSSVPRSEQVLPTAVVDGTRGYIEKVVQQANGCYEHQWFDACAVMLRKLVEILIIEVYEANGKSADIQDKDKNYFMLGELVDRLLAETAWTLGRETKKYLPEIKDSGNRSAHNRRYVAKRADLDKLMPGLRIVADELLHLAKLK